MLTVQSQFQGKNSKGQSRFTPCLRLRGAQLAAAGYKAGDKVRVEVNDDGSLTIRLEQTAKAVQNGKANQ